jgi:hypothetical protein
MRPRPDTALTTNRTMCAATQTLRDAWPTVCTGDPGAMDPAALEKTRSARKQCATAERPAKTSIHGST